MFKNIVKIGIDCCGCGNCFYICKKDAITLKADDEGFIQPFVNCNCGLRGMFECLSTNKGSTNNR